VAGLHSNFDDASIAGEDAGYALSVEYTLTFALQLRKLTENLSQGS